MQILHQLLVAEYGECLLNAFVPHERVFIKVQFSIWHSVDAHHNGNTIQCSNLSICCFCPIRILKVGIVCFDSLAVMVVLCITICVCRNQLKHFWLKEELEISQWCCCCCVKIIRQFGSTLISKIIQE